MTSKIQSKYFISESTIYSTLEFLYEIGSVYDEILVWIYAKHVFKQSDWMVKILNQLERLKTSVA